MNRINKKLKSEKKLLSIYFTAGYPQLKDTVRILKSLQSSGVDMVEIGMPFSDPLADGPTIQNSGSIALKNGMTTKLLFAQLKDIRKEINIPLILMGYLNPILQFGVAAFCKACADVGVDGLIIPDLPVKEYKELYKKTFEKYGLLNIFLITPQTTDARIRYIDSISKGFIYMVSSAATTGSRNSFNANQTAYFKRITTMNLENPQIVGFGISNNKTFTQATQFAKGAIIGSAFIKQITQEGLSQIPNFIRKIRVS
ncbi:MAG: tryptophan synthase subunit alpha [Flavobacteriaceae bacterium]|nr:tryptophan synthase subunit alpha [Flavobacteriaceae bacterium]